MTTPEPDAPQGHELDTGTLEVGIVSKPHGVRGEVRVALHWEHSDVLLDVDELTLQRPDGGERRYVVEVARPVSKAVLVKLAGVDDRDAADALRGARVRVPRGALPPMAEDEYYLVDLVGCRVTTPEGELGRVSEVRVNPTIDTIVVTTPEGEAVEQPLGEAWVDEVDLSARVVRLKSGEGLIR